MARVENAVPQKSRAGDVWSGLGRACEGASQRSTSRSAIETCRQPAWLPGRRIRRAFAKACDDIRDRIARAAVRDSNTDAAALKLVGASLRGTSLGRPQFVLRKQNTLGRLVGLRYRPTISRLAR